MKAHIQGDIVGSRTFKIILSYDNSNGERKQKEFLCAECVWYEHFNVYDSCTWDGFLKTIEFADANIRGRSFSYTISQEKGKSTLTIKTWGFLYNDVITLYA
jgi:hypothetical protein